ncbi:hypothetical protein ACOSP7_027540 [Xanthoceras sorbifolium]
MTSTVGLELTTFLNPDLTWKKVSKKGNRSATRRNRKPVAKFLTAGVELADKSPRRAEDTTVSDPEKADKSSSRAEDTTVSDSEKLGVAVLGRRFSDKMEHVPIKKRKYYFRSPSPPPRTPSPRSNVAHSCPNSSAKRVQMAVDASTASIVSQHGVDGKVSEAMNGKLDFREDFSGIEMLADAVCSDSFDGNVDHTVENPAAEEPACRKNDSGMLKEETGVSLETTNICPKDTLIEDRVEESSFQDATPAFEQKSRSLEDNTMEESSVSLCNERLHWDLNVVMDDWQQPSDIVNVETDTVEGSSMDKSEKLNILKSDKTDRETGETDVVKDDDMVNKLVSSEIHLELNRQDNQLEACSGLDRNHEECGADGKPSSKVVSIDECLSNVPCPSHMASNASPPPFLEEQTKSGLIEDKVLCVENVQVEEHDVTSPYVQALDGITHEVDTTLKIDGITHEVESTALKIDGITQEVDVTALNMDGITHKVDSTALKMDGVTHEVDSTALKMDGATLEVDSIALKMDGVTHEVDSTALKIDGEDSGRASSLHSDISAPQEVSNINNFQQSGAFFLAVEPTCEVEKAGISHVSLRCEDVSTSSAPVEEVQLVATGEKNPLADEAFHNSEVDSSVQNPLAADEALPFHAIEIDSSVHAGTEEVILVASGNIEKNPLAAEEALPSHTSEIDSSVHAGSEEVILVSSGNLDKNSLAAEEALPSHTSEIDFSVHAGSGEVIPVSSGNLEKNPIAADEALPSHTDEIDSSVHAGSEEVTLVSSGNLIATMKTFSGFTTHEDCIDYAPTKSSDEIYNEDPNDKICESDAQIDKGHMIGSEISRELQAGYDSQFEDGELRETDVHCWDENEGDSAEIEQVDYESECDAERLCISEAEGGESILKLENGSTRGCGDVTEKIEECAIGDASRDNITSSKMRTLEATDSSKLKIESVDCEDGLNSKDFSSKVVGSSKREFLSRPEGSLSSDTIQRSGFDNCDDLFPRSEKEAASKSMERDRSALQMRCRSPPGGDGHIVNTRQSPTYDGLYGSGRPRPRSIIETRGYVMASDRTIPEATGVEGFENHVRRQYLSSSSNSVYRPLNRRSLAYRDDMNGFHAGPAPVRDGNNPDRSRFRRYPQGGVSRDIREDYHRPMSNYSSDHVPPHRLARRERSISPGGGGRLNYAPQPYKKSRSRSRSRSPTSRLLLRERNEGSRRRSRSPNFRSAVSRIDRVSLPFQKRFAADYEEGFISPPRKRFSPQHNSQFDDRIPAMENFRSPNFRPLRVERMRMPFQKHFAADYEEGFMSPPRKRFSPPHNSQFDDRISALENFRSPNFRSVRMDRVPFQKQFAADYEEGFISPPRKRFSPQHNPQFDERISALDNFRSSNFRSVRTDRAPRKRFSPQNNSRFDEQQQRISALDNFRDRQSSPPVRNFRQGQRFDSVRSIRPIGHPRRFPDMGGGAGRGGYNKYEGVGEDDRRKPGSRFDMIPRVTRRYDDSGSGDGVAPRRMPTEDE